MMQLLFGSTGLVPPSPLQEPLRQEIDLMVRQLKEVLKDGLADDFTQAINALAQHGDELRTAAVLWIEVIHRLVQAAEQRYPHKHGALKKSIVKSAMHYLIESDRFDVPSVPPYLEPFVVDVVADWAIDVVVAMTTQHGLWDTGKATGHHMWAPAMWSFHLFGEIGGKIWPPVAAVVLAICRFFQRKADLTPELKAALDAVVKRRLLSRKMDLLGHAPDAIVWIGDHGEELQGVVQLVFEGVQLAEGFLDKSGADKKEYVRALVLAALDEFGISFGDGLVAVLVNTFLDTAIDSAVNSFNTFPTHSPAFKHRKRPAQAVPPPAAAVSSASLVQQHGLLGWKLQKFRR